MILFDTFIGALVFGFCIGVFATLFLLAYEEWKDEKEWDK